MSIPIAPTPILEGKNAKRFDRLVKQGLKKPVDFVPTPGLEEVKKKIAKGPEIDYKKAFDLILEHYGHGGSKFSCKLCKALEIHCLSSGECNDKIIEAIKRKCTKGGE